MDAARAVNRRDFLAAGGSAAIALGALGPRWSALGATVSRAGRPRPSPQQLAWQRGELGLFAHFGVNTFTGREWGDGQENPRIFDPVRLDARQWARAAKAGGFRLLVLTAKHHDGFCLWPTATTTHSVRRSPWRDGRGDVVREVADACRAEGLQLGLYLSPWDRHEPSYGDSPRYNDLYVRQLTELLTGYGPVAEVWFDGANGEGPNGRRQEYDWPSIHRTVRALQPGALIFSDAGPDIRWIGNEKGTAGDPNWCTVDPDAVPRPGMSGAGVTRALQHGDPDGSVWRPGEADVSIRPGWFYRPAEDDQVRTADDLVELYFSSVGRNANLLLNVPPTRDGLFHPTDATRLAEFSERLQALFATDLARGAPATASSTRDRVHGPDRVTDGDPETYWSPPAGETTGWVELALERPAAFDVVDLREAIAYGQAVARYRVEAWTGGRWTTLVRGTTIGHRKLDRTASLMADRVRLTVEAATGAPMIATLALYRGGA